MIYFTADPHFGHPKIIDYCARPFDSVEDMDNALIKAYNFVVKKDDIVFFVGDFSLKTAEHYAYYGSILKRLNGQKHLVLGNHDDLKPFSYTKVGFMSVHTSLLVPSLRIDNREVILMHDPSVVTVDKNKLWLVGHVHELFVKAKNCINVGVDVWNYAPVGIDKLEKIAKAPDVYL